MSLVDTANSKLSQELRDRLQSLMPEQLEIIDESHLHAGHAGAREGKHFRVSVISHSFSKQNTVSRHRMVFNAVGDLMQGPIHALAISAKTPEEV